MTAPPEGSRPTPRLVDRLLVADVPPGTVGRFRVWIAADGMGDRIRVPVVVVRGQEPGPVVGLTAAIHGNELNGIRVIHRVLEALDPARLRGTVVAVPVLNVPGYLLHRREFHDGKDLNRIMPGQEGGACAEVYAARLLERIITQCEYLFDLHTASFGRVNSLYVRADMNDPEVARIARLLDPQIVLHNTGDGTLRSAAAARGIKSVTFEVGDPQRFQRDMIRDSAAGILHVLGHLDLIEPQSDPREGDPVVCGRSYWLYTDVGGVLEVQPKVAALVRKGDVLARVSDVFGDVLREYVAPEDAVVIGKSSNPVAPTGSRILHLGIPGDPERAA